MSLRASFLRGVVSLVACAALSGCSGDSTGGGDGGGNDNPRVTGVSPATLTPGATALITGTNFAATPAGNTVSIGGVLATVLGGTATELQVTVPCLLSGNVAVQVSAAGVASAAFNHPLQGNRRTLAVGQSAIVSSAAETGCNEIAAAGGPARYVLAVYNTSAAPTSSASFQVSGDGVASAEGPLPSPSLVRRAPGGPAALSMVAEDAARERGDRAHLDLLEKDRAAYAQLFQRFGSRPRTSGARRSVAPVAPPATRAFRISNINSGGICANFYSVNATRVYFNGKIAIYQDDANPITTTHPALGAVMQDYYNKIGDQFNTDMEPIIRANFGDVLRRDSLTDNNGVLVALFTNTINQNMPNVAGFVVSCDQFPNDEGAGNTNTASNNGEYFYAYVPTDEGYGYSAFTPDSWYRTIRSTFIHESKHVASHAARVANNAPTWESGWLEEGTARHSEELWARNSVYGVAWKGNTGYGSVDDFGSIYCDVRPTVTGCSAANPRRPSVNMQRHFSTGGLYEFMGNPTARSPFGRSGDDSGASFYATSWSLVRYAIDRYAASDAAFLNGLNQSVSGGTANLAARAGVSIEQLMGGWALALFTDDYPGLAGAGADLRFPTWNLRDIYAGLQRDFPNSYTRAQPIMADQLTFGAIAPLNVPSIVGGGVKYYELSGTQTAGQLIRLEAAGGGAVSSTLRLAIARLQ